MKKCYLPRSQEINGISILIPDIFFINQQLQESQSNLLKGVCVIPDNAWGKHT